MVSTRPRPALRQELRRQAVRRNGHLPTPKESPPNIAAELELALLVALVVYAFAARLLVAVQLPPWQGPDEPKHFEYIRMLVDMRDQLWAEHRLLEIADTSPTFQQQVIASMARNDYWPYVGQTTPDPLPDSFVAIWKGGGTELHRPSLYYFAAAFIVAPLVDAPIEDQLLAVRVYSAVLSTIAVLIAYFAARVAWRNDALIGLIAAAFVAALPMNVFVGSIVTVDNLAILIGGVLALALARGLTMGFGRGMWLLAIASVVLGLATKREFLGVLPGVLLAFAVWGFRHRGLLKNRRNMMFIGAALLVIAVASGFALRSESFVHFSESISAYALNESDQMVRLLHPPLSNDELVTLIDFQRKEFFSSFWGVFGWFTNKLNPDLETGLKVVSLLCGVGLVISLVTNRREPNHASRVWFVLVTMVMILTLTVLAFGIALSYFSKDYLPQGRQIFGVLVPIAILTAIGARALFPRSRLGTWPLAPVLAALLVVLDVVVYVQISPWFVGRTFLDS